MRTGQDKPKHFRTRIYASVRILSVASFSKFFSSCFRIVLEFFFEFSASFCEFSLPTFFSMARRCFLFMAPQLPLLVVAVRGATHQRVPAACAAYKF